MVSTAAVDGTVPPAPPTLLGGLTMATIFFLPLGHLLVVPLGGSIAAATDLATGLLVVAWLGFLVVSEGARAELVDQWRHERRRRFVLGIGVLILYGTWVALSGLWGYHPRYALVKGVGAAAYAVAALVITCSGLKWRYAVDAWLLGAALALVVTFGGALFGPELLRLRVTYSGGGIVGLPMPRLSGPFVHPNMFGEWLVLTLVLVRFRHPELSPRGQTLATALAVGLALALALTVSTAWIGAGVVVAVVGWRRKRRVEKGWSGVLRGLGAAVAGLTLGALLVAVDLRPWGIDVVTNGLRPQIWWAAREPILHAPFTGVGASPLVVAVTDPVLGGDPFLWDAHNALLSVLAQFGVVGALLLGVGWGLCLTGARGAWVGRQGAALWFVWIAVAVGSLFMASEDMRHIWVLLGVTGLAAASAPVAPVTGGRKRRPVGTPP